MVTWSLRRLPAFHSHEYTWSRFKRSAHVRDDFVIGELESVMAQEVRQDNPRLCLSKRRADTCPRSAAKRDVTHGRGLASVGETFGAERIGVLPNFGVAVGEVDGVEEPLARRDGVSLKVNLFCYDAIADVDGRVQSQAFFDDLIEQRGFFERIHFFNETLENVWVLAKQGKSPGKERRRSVMTGDHHRQHLVADEIVGQSRVEEMLQEVVWTVDSGRWTVCNRPSAVGNDFEQILVQLPERLAKAGPGDFAPEDPGTRRDVFDGF